MCVFVLNSQAYVVEHFQNEADGDNLDNGPQIGGP